MSADDESELKAKQSKVGKSNVSRSKNHERKVAHLLTDWTGCEFRRRRVEGRDSTVIERESTADVISVRDDIRFSIEAKCGEMASFDALLANPAKTKFGEWWHQTCYDVKLLTDVFNRRFYPMLFFRPIVNCNWIAISSHAFSDGILKPRVSLDAPLCRTVWFSHFNFDAYSYIGPVSHNVSRTKKKANFKYVELTLDPIVFCRWEDFSSNVDPASFFLNKE